MKINNKIQSKLRPGIAMIELIFSLVIIGITLSSAPLLIRTSTQSSLLALQQESIAAAVTQMNIIMTSQWDHADTNSTIGEPTLTTNSAIFGQCSGAATRAKGVTSDSGRYCLGVSGPTISYPASAIGTDSSIGELLAYDDVDDYNAKNYTVSVYQNDSYATSSGDYIDTDIDMTSAVYYGDDVPRYSDDSTGAYEESTTFANPFRHTNPVVGTTNIKLFSVTLSSSNTASELTDKSITLSAFMCNIGAPKEFITNEGIL